MKIKAYHGLKLLFATGMMPTFSTYEKGLIKLTNKAALLISFIVTLVLMPIAIFGDVTAPILASSSVFFPLTLLLNHYQRFKAARHYLLGLLYTLMLLISLFRGLDSGILFVSIPTILLAFIFFTKEKSLYLHLSILGILLVVGLVYSYHFQPIAPYAPQTLYFVYPIHLSIGIALSLSFIHFFFKVHGEYQRELMELNNTKNKLLSIIGHDIKGPLNSLKGVLHLLNNRHLSQEEFYMLSGNLQKSTENLYSTLNNLLHWSLSQMKGFESKPAMVNLYELSSEMEALFAESARNKNIAILNKIPHETVAYADPNQIQLVLRNLLNNALKYTPADGCVQLDAASQKTGLLQLSVTDTGLGISPESMRHLFSNTINSSKGTQGESGTGLGLLLCKEMVEANGGHIWASSEVEKGSIFTFTLPMQETVSQSNKRPTVTADPALTTAHAG